MQDDSSVKLWNSGGPHLDDIDTGCNFAKTYILSTVASLLKKDSDYITGLFNEQTTNYKRGYTVNVHTGDAFHEVSVDDYDWFKSCNDEPGASALADNTMWMALLEKAFAKAYGNYERINDASVEEAFLWMTGRPAISTVPLNGAEDEFLYVEKMIDEGHVVTAKAWDSGVDYLGLHQGNVYSVLNTYNIQIGPWDVQLYQVRQTINDINFSG